MKKFGKAQLFFAAIASSALLFTALASASPGSEIDPVVTRSYVDKKINEAVQLLSGQTQQPSQNTQTPQTPQTAQAVFTPILIKAGQTLLGGEGCEIILRTGDGVIVTTTDTIVNVSTGSDMKAGANVPKGHLLIIPRDDGRGIKASSDCWLLVKGSCTVN